MLVSPGQAGLLAFEAARKHPRTDRWRRWRSGAAGLAQFPVGEGVAVDGLLEEPLEQQAAAARVAAVEAEDPLVGSRRACALG